jgi:amidophosphoribosyltransferase
MERGDLRRRINTPRILQDKFQDKCGVFGVYGPDNSPHLVWQGLKAINHRGQDSAGIAVSDGINTRLYAAAGLVPQAIDENFIKSIQRPMAIGHVRYGTSGGSGHEQPVQIELQDGSMMYFAHNGNIPSVRRLGRFLEEQGYSVTGKNDSEMAALATAIYKNQGASDIDAIYESSRHYSGAYTYQIMIDGRMTMIKDAYANKPGGFARLQNGYLLSSESIGSDAIGGYDWTELDAGQAITIDQNGLHKPIQLFAPNRKFHVFEIIYSMHKDSVIDGVRIGDIRKESGRELEREHPSDADYVVSVVESGDEAGIGFHEESGIPQLYVLKKRQGALRSFIASEQSQREAVVDGKFEYQYLDKIQGKKLVTVDDSQVRGTTAPRLNRKLISLGARAVDNRFASPEVLFEDLYGNMDVSDRGELIATRLRGEAMRQHLGSESYGYLSLDGLKRVLSRMTGRRSDEFNYACFDGDYPIDIEDKVRQDERIPALV